MENNFKKYFAFYVKKSCFRAFKEYSTNFSLNSFGCRSVLVMKVRKLYLQCKFPISSLNTLKKLFLEFNVSIIANVKYNFYTNSKSKVMTGKNSRRKHKWVKCFIKTQKSKLHVLLFILFN